MKKEYKIIIFSYIAMQLLSGLLVQLTAIYLNSTGMSEQDIQYYSLSIWPFVSFAAVFIISLFLLRREFSLRDSAAAPVFSSFFWAVGGVFLVIAAQALAIQIEALFGIQPGSENTRDIMQMIKIAPAMIIVTCILGPALEEIIFRKIIFGTLYKKFNFWISALFSSVIFAAAHVDFEHIILYSAIGITFAFLYVKTKRIIVPIATHCLMNSYVVYAQLVYEEDIENRLGLVYYLAKSTSKLFQL